jgi:hypothetical protein
VVGEAGAPDVGPGVPGDPSKGEARLERGVSFAGRLRRTLMLAGVERHPCKQPDVRHTEKTACRPELASDPVYKEAGWSLPRLARGDSATSFATAPTGAGQKLNQFGAGHEIRTRDPQLGKLMLYQLS